MNGAKVVKDVSEFSKQNLCRLAQQQLGPVGKVSSVEMGGGCYKKRTVVGFRLSIKAAVNGWEVESVLSAALPSLWSRWLCGDS